MIIIRKVADPHGCWSNMAPYPVVHEGKTYRTTEALFQSLRFADEGIIEAIRAEKSPMASKFVAKKHRAKMVVEPRSAQDLDHMRLCLRLKLEQHPELVRALLDTGGQHIVEDWTNRKRGSGLFWGAALVDREWHGENWLGRLWMELRGLLSEGFL
jgi:N-glycosidase YbiA